MTLYRLSLHAHLNAQNIANILRSQHRNENPPDQALNGNHAIDEAELEAKDRTVKSSQPVHHYSTEA